MLKAKWDTVYQDTLTNSEGSYLAQCAVTGETAPIARTHGKIKGIYGGNPTGCVLVSYNCAAENSYGHAQSRNSDVSVEAMNKYTSALNYLLSNNKHKIQMDDITIVFWAMDASENHENLFRQMLFGQSNEMSAIQIEHMLQALWKDARSGKITENRLNISDVINPNTAFYMLGMKPNVARISVKFFIRQKYADILWNIAQFQQDMQISNEYKPVSLQRLKNELTSPKSSNDKINPSLAAGLIESVLYGRPYPAALLDTMVRRVKTDDSKINAVRTGTIKACINRNYNKEEFEVALDENNHNQAYLCGRLFAVLERLQQAASRGKLNKTIKDTYFASATAKPALIFPKLIQLAQHHLRKVNYPMFFDRSIGEIIDGLDSRFPEVLSLKEQGEFIIGYYQQTQQFYKTSKNKNSEQEDTQNGII